MSIRRPFGRYLARYPQIAVLCYVGLVLTLMFATWAALADTQRHAAIAAASDMLDQLEGRKRPAGGAASPLGPVPSGSPFSKAKR